MYWAYALTLLSLAWTAPLEDKEIHTTLEGHGITDADLELPVAFIVDLDTPEGKHRLHLVRNEELHNAERPELHLGDERVDHKIQKREASFYHGLHEAAHVGLFRKNGNVHMSGLLFKRDNLYEINPKYEDGQLHASLHTVKKTDESEIEQYKKKMTDLSVEAPMVTYAEQLAGPAPNITIKKKPEIRSEEEFPSIAAPNTTYQDSCAGQKIYTVELGMLHDFTVYNFYDRHSDHLVTHDSIMEEVEYRSTQIMNTMHAVYSSSFQNTCTTVHLKLKLIALATSKGKAPYTEDNINKNSGNDATPAATSVFAGKVLDSISAYAKNKNINVDHLMAFTYYDLLGTNDNPGCVGLAPLGGICTATLDEFTISVSVIEMQGMHSDLSAAHELGHNLGSPHDPDDDSSCSASVGYIMGPYVTSPPKTQYAFSTCSVQSMDEEMNGKKDGLPKVCIVDDSCTYTKIIDPNVPTGKKVPEEYQCEEFTDSSDYQKIDNDRISGFEGTKEYCQKLFCWNQATGDVKYFGGMWPNQGTVCGKNKQCIHGECVNSDVFKQKFKELDNSESKCNELTVPSVPSDKATDKGVRITISNANDVLEDCADMKARYASLCFEDYYFNRCSSTCWDQRLDIWWKPWTEIYV